MRSKGLIYQYRNQRQKFQPIFSKKFDHLETLLAIQKGFVNCVTVPASQRKLTQISGAKPRSDPLQNAGSRALFYPKSIMPQISTEDSGILQLTKNAKTNNTIAGYYLISRRVIFTPADVQLVYRCPKRTFILPQRTSCFQF